MAAGLLSETGGPVQAQALPVTPPASPATRLIPLPPTRAATEQQRPGPQTLLPPARRLGIAVVGLGNLALAEVIPALGQTQYCKLAALVSGSPDKAGEVAAQHGLPARSVYSYGNYDAIRNNPDVDIIYIILPNSMHAEYTVRGVHRAGRPGRQAHPVREADGDLVRGVPAND